jgi:hypothetical protein
MALKGALLVVGEPVRQATALSFWLKMALVAVGVASAAAFGRVVRAAAHPAGERPEFSAGTKSVAVATVALWLAIIFLGRAIGYDIEIWESLSPVSGG